MRAKLLPEGLWICIRPWINVRVRSARVNGGVLERVVPIPAFQVLGAWMLSFKTFPSLGPELSGVRVLVSPVPPEKNHHPATVPEAKFSS